MPEQKTQNCFAMEELQQLLKQSPDQFTIIDVRTPEEYADKHIPAAINIPLDELNSHVNELSKQLLADKVDKSKEIVVDMFDNQIVFRNK